MHVGSPAFDTSSPSVTSHFNQDPKSLATGSALFWTAQTFQLADGGEIMWLELKYLKTDKIERRSIKKGSHLISVLCSKRRGGGGVSDDCSFNHDLCVSHVIYICLLPRSLPNGQSTRRCYLATSGRHSSHVECTWTKRYAKVDSVPVPGNLGSTARPKE